MATQNAINSNIPIPVAFGGTGAITLTAHSLTLGQGTSAITALGAATNGQIPVGSTGADPVLATISVGTGLMVTNGAGTITLTATGGGVSWTDVTGTSQSAAINNGYTANNAGLVTITLPVTAAYGSILRIVGKGAGGWKLAQNASQLIHFNGSVSTTGATGFIASSAQYDCVELLCTVADTTWTAVSSEGNITIS